MQCIYYLDLMLCSTRFRERIRRTYKIVYNAKKAEFRQAAARQYYDDYQIREAAEQESVRLQAAALLNQGRAPNNEDFIVSYSNSNNYFYNCTYISALITISSIRITCSNCTSN